jgi:uncharacterized protein
MKCRQLAATGIIATSLALILPAEQVCAASFDCSKASNIVETLICTDPNLSRLDDQMATAYAAPHNQSRDLQKLIADQRAWLRQRNACQTASCITTAYQQRIAALGGQPSSNIPATQESPAPQPGGLLPQTPQSVPPALTTTDGKRIQTVVADGMGGTIESAVQNAAENALKQVVGTFVDTDKQIERRTQIDNGIRTESHNISSKVREYSQGSIQSFDVLDTKQEGGIFRVSARIGVRIDDFKVYIKRLAEGEGAIGEGIFAQVATIKKNEAGASGIFADNIMMPLLSGQVSEFEVGTPQLLSSWLNGPDAAKFQIAIRTESRFRPFTQDSGSIIVPIVARVKSLYLENIEKSLASIASAKNRVPSTARLNYASICGGVAQQGPPESYCISISEANDISDLYVLSGVRNPQIGGNPDDLRALVLGHGLQGIIVGPRSGLFPNLDVSLIGDGAEVVSEFIGPIHSNQNVAVIGNFRNFDFAGMTMTEMIHITPVERFYVILNLPPEVLAKAKRINVKLVASK